MQIDDFKIAGGKRASDWVKFKERLVSGLCNPEDWAVAFHECFEVRIQSRYLKPIAQLEKNSTLEGEGFSIVTIQCALIEFLAATQTGKRYKFLRNGEKLGEFEYNKSRELFVNFLSSSEPFNSAFDQEIANDFYSSVRCGLLHEAATKNGWKIWASNEKIVCADRKIVFRDSLQKAIKEFLKKFGERLLTEEELQKAFVRKFDHLAARD